MIITAELRRALASIVASQTVEQYETAVTDYDREAERLRDADRH